jgi:peptidoglycan/LPS O-acetylase OafA/YrhL
MRPNVQLPEELDAIRGSSAIIVAVAHFVQIWVVPSVNYNSCISQVTGLAATYAVNIFFVLSGFMIALSAIRHRTPQGSFEFLEFFKSRAYRLLPPYYAAVFLSISFVFFINVTGLYGAQTYRLPGDIDIVRESAFVNRGDLIWSATLFYGVIDNVGRSLYFNGPLWSLSIEWWLYVLCAVGTYAWLNRNLAARIGFALALVGLFIWGDPVFLKFGTVWLCAFAMGLSIAQGYRISIRHTLLAAGVCAVAMVAFSYGQLWQSLLDRSAPTIVGSGIAMAFYMAWRSSEVQNAGPIVRLLSASAGWSYTLYLIHFPIMMLGFSLTRPLAHQFGPVIEYLVGFIWLLSSILVASKIGPILENRRAIREWLERRIGKHVF